MTARVQDRTIGRCWFHRQNWRRISSIAIHALKRIEQGEELDWELAERKLRERAVRDVEMLLTQAQELLSHDDAISWSPTYPDLIGNGAHRICALKAQQVESTVVLVTR